ncbi:MAG: globin domain-containing protein [Sulfurimonadaceae bacterium]
MSLSPKTIEIVKATAAPVAANSEAITTRMYEILFANHPETKELFRDADPSQHKKLAGAVSAYAANIDNLDVLSKAVENMAQTHVRTKVKPEHYPLVGVSLLQAVKDVLGDAATDDVIEAWKEAYFFLADILIAREKELYAA